MPRRIDDRSLELPEPKRRDPRSEEALSPARGLALGLTLSGAIWAGIAALFLRKGR
ncbi:hypothetical protein [Aureimonas sp. Leaf454]|uniref:hypothetical protein n=1 Tax=Aureimonas sp. Leaf454 TaxID=1736381 RepID=UPI000A4A82B7|nr:hypothetical protein [Aureimonas sp. Leaf454]